MMACMRKAKAGAAPDVSRGETVFCSDMTTASPRKDKRQRVDQM